MNFITFLTLLLSAVAAVAIGNVGGWAPADTKSPSFIDSLKFGVEHEFPEHEYRYTILEAKQQVVAGMKYDFTLELIPNGHKCVVQHFVVLDKFGVKSLLESNKVSDCAEH